MLQLTIVSYNSKIFLNQTLIRQFIRIITCWKSALKMNSLNLGYSAMLDLDVTKLTMQYLLSFKLILAQSAEEKIGSK